MADITDAQAVNFCDTFGRTIADQIISLDRTMSQFMVYVVRDFEDNTGGNADGDPIIDGSPADGRPPLTKLSVAELKFVVEQLIATLDTDNRRELVNNWVVNPKPIY